MLKLREFRQKMGYSQAHISRILDIPPSTYANWEQGTREPNIESLAKIAIALECTVDDLIDFKKLHNELSEDILEMIHKTKEPTK